MEEEGGPAAGGSGSVVSWREKSRGASTSVVTTQVAPENQLSALGDVLRTVNARVGKKRGRDVENSAVVAGKEKAAGGGKRQLESWLHLSGKKIINKEKKRELEHIPIQLEKENVQDESDDNMFQLMQKLQDSIPKSSSAPPKNNVSSGVSSGVTISTSMKSKIEAKKQAALLRRKLKQQEKQRQMQNPIRKTINPPKPLQQKMPTKPNVVNGKSQQGYSCDNVEDEDDLLACQLAEQIEKQHQKYPALLPDYSGSSPENAERFARFKITKVKSISDEHGNEGYRCEIVSRPGDIVANVELRGIWANVSPRTGDYINLIWSSLESPKWQDSTAQEPLIVDDQHHFLVLCPDFLLPPTRIASSIHCLRRAVLGDHVSSFQPTKSSVMGNAKHEMVERCLVPYDVPTHAPGKGSFHYQDIEATTRAIVHQPKFVEQFFSVDQPEKEALAELEKAVPALVQFGQQFMGNDEARPKGIDANRTKGNVVLFRDGRSADLNIEEFMGTEEMIISPMWGLKGMPDVLIRASLTNMYNSLGKPEAACKSMMFPVELKTGSQLKVEHDAQVQLYSLLLGDKYRGTGVVGEGPNHLQDTAGLLLHLAQDRSTKQVRATLQPVKRSHQLIAQLLAKRNEVVARISPEYLRGSSSNPAAEKHDAANGPNKGNADKGQDFDITKLLPPVIGNAGNECAHCYEKASCMILHKTLEGGTLESSGLAPEQFDGLVGHVSETHSSYVKSWMTMIQLEEDTAKGYQREIWTLSGPQREAKGRCISCLRLVESCLESSSKTTRAFVTRFQRRAPLEDDPAHVPIAELHFEVGEYVCVGIEGKHYGLARGVVSEIQHDTIAVRSTNPIPVPQSATSMLALDALVWRIDKDELFNGMRIVKNNLVTLCHGDAAKGPGKGKGEETKGRLRSLVIDLVSPRFVDDEETVKDLAARRPNNPPTPRWLRDCTDLPRQLWNGRYRLQDVHNFAKLCAMIRLDKRALAANKSVGSNAAHQALIDTYVSLNPDQRRAVSAVLAAQDYVCIHGMPGTGKTTTLAFLVQALSALGCSVLVCAYTHTALDNLLLKLQDRGVEFSRIGSTSNTRSELSRHLLSNSATTVEQMQALAESPRLVIGSTCLSAAKHPLVRKRQFDFCIIDEAGQLTQPVCLGPLCFANTFVLVGDDRQLPPLVKSPAAKKLGMDVSLLARLGRKQPDAVVSLRHQFRMHKDIMALANHLTYSGELRCGSEAIANRRLNYRKDIWPHAAALRHTCGASPDQWLVDVLDPGKAVLFLDTDGIGDGGAQERRTGAALVRISSSSASPSPCSPTSSSGAQQNQLCSQGLSTQGNQRRHLGKLENEAEAKLVRALVHGFVSCGIAPKRIGVISPYRSQLKILRTYLQPYLPELEIQTVDKYQGRDKDVIIVSLVRSNTTRDVGGLLRDWRRINVAFTRAKCKLVVIGSRQTLESSKVFHSFISMVSEKRWTKLLPIAAHLHFDSILNNPKPSGTKSRERSKVRELIPPSEASGMAISRNVCIEALY